MFASAFALSWTRMAMERCPEKSLLRCLSETIAAGGPGVRGSWVLRPFGGFNRGTPMAGWFRREDPNLTWMMTGGTPILGTLHSFDVVFFDFCQSCLTSVRLAATCNFTCRRYSCIFIFFSNGGLSFPLFRSNRVRP